jgi:hypothetical protein
MAARTISAYPLTSVRLNNPYGIELRHDNEFGQVRFRIADQPAPDTRSRLCLGLYDGGIV